MSLAQAAIGQPLQHLLDPFETNPFLFQAHPVADAVPAQIVVKRSFHLRSGAAVARSNGLVFSTPEGSACQ